MPPPERRLTYLIGVPGSGKTTVVDEVTRYWRPWTIDQPIAHQAWMDDDKLQVVTLGRPRSQFSGTDTLSMSVQPRAISWLTGRLDGAPPPPRVLAEGDRLSNIRFFDALADAGWTLTLWWMDTPEVVASARRAQRGSYQNAAWIRGRVTKIRNLVDALGDRVRRLDGTQPIVANADIVRRGL